MVKVPRQHLAHAAVDEKLGRVGHAEEGELPIRIEVLVRRRLSGQLVTEAGERVFDEGEAFDEGGMLGGECGGEADAFIVRDDIGAVDVEEVEDAFEVLRGGLRGVVVVGGDGGVAAAAVVGGDDGIVLGEEGADGVPSELWRCGGGC